MTSACILCCAYIFVDFTCLVLSIQKNMFKETNSVLELVPILTILSYYIQCVFVTLWIIMKWCMYFTWKSISLTAKVNAIKSTNDYYGGYHDKPPACLIDNKLGRQSYVKLKGTKFHYVEAGIKSNPLVLFLHGFPDCWFGWNNQIKELSAFFRVVALDLKGFNDSDKPLWRNAYKPQAICQELVQFIKSLGAHSAIVIGHDLGAEIGWLLAHLYPDNIERLIAVSAPHPNLMWNNLHPKSQINNNWLKFIQCPYLPESDLSRGESIFLEKCLSHLVQEKRLQKSSYISNDSDDTISSNTLDAYKYVFNRKSDWTGPLNYYRNFPFYKIADGKTIRCPCLIITGNEDTFCTLESIVKSTEYCDNFVLKIIEGAGHWPHQQMADEFNKVVLKFLVGKRAYIVEPTIMDKNNKGLMGRMFGAMSNSVKISSLALETVQQKANEVFQNARI